jgi:hypothetical protein
VGVLVGLFVRVGPGVYVAVGRRRVRVGAGVVTTGISVLVGITKKPSVGDSSGFTVTVSVGVGVSVGALVGSGA